MPLMEPNFGSTAARKHLQSVSLRSQKRGGRQYGFEFAWEVFHMISEHSPLMFCANFESSYLGEQICQGFPRCSCSWQNICWILCQQASVPEKQLKQRINQMLDMHLPFIIPYFASSILVSDTEVVRCGRLDCVQTSYLISFVSNQNQNLFLQCTRLVAVESEARNPAAIVL